VVGRPTGWLARVSVGVLVALVVASGATATPVAVAATVSLERGVLSYRAQPGELNEPSITLHPEGQPSIEVADLTPTYPLIAGRGCVVVGPSGDDPVVRCPLVAGAARPRLSVALGDGRDHGSFDGRLVGRVDGGPGNDGIDGAGLLEGGPGDDVLVLTPRRHGKALGGVGDDELSVDHEARTGAVLEGGSGDDDFQNGKGRDVLRGGPGNDEFQDLLFRDPGNVYDLGSGRDKVVASGGPDTILARDGEHDDLSCFGGRDSVMLDALDFYDQKGSNRCERVRRRGLARAWLDPGVAYLKESVEGDAGPNELVLGFKCPHDGPRICAGTLTVSDRRGTVFHAPFRTRNRGRRNKVFRTKRRTLRALDNWARLTIVSYDRSGARHRRTIAGRNVVDIFVDPYERPPNDGD